jgi:hypothetical protein
VSEPDYDPDADPDNLEGRPPTDEERAANHRALMKLHPANRFRLMFGQPLLPETPPPATTTDVV